MGDGHVQTIRRCVRVGVTSIRVECAGPDLLSTSTELVHVADMVASDDNVDIALPAPVPEDLEAHGYAGVEL